MASPTSSLKRASIAFTQAPDEAGIAPPVQAAILRQTKALGELYYFLQVGCEKDGTTGFFLRTYEDIVALDQRVRETMKNMGGVQFFGEAASMRAIGELPQAEKFGFRRRVSQMGLTDYNTERARKLQEYLNSMLSQLPRLRDEPLFAEWFGDDASVVDAGRDPATVAKLKFLAKHLAKMFTPRTPEECEAEPVYGLSTSVRVVGLQNTTEFNNMLGVVQSHEVDVDKIRKSISSGASPLETSVFQAGSYVIQMVDGQMAKAKAVNVRLWEKQLSDAELALGVQAEVGASSPKRASVAALLGLAES